MRIIAVVADGWGRTHIVATRAPEIFRRQLAAETGQAMLAWCCLAPADTGARAFVAGIKARLLPVSLGDHSFATDANATRAIRVIRLELALAAARRRVRSLIRPIRRTIAWAARVTSQIL